MLKQLQDQSIILINIMHNFFSPPRYAKRKRKKVSNYLQRLLLVLFVGIIALVGCQSILPVIKEDKVIHLTLWQGVNPPPNWDVLQRLVDKFNQSHPDIQVERSMLGNRISKRPRF